MGELQKGIIKLDDSKKKQSLTAWLESDLTKRFEKRILSISEAVAYKWGEIQGISEKQGNKMSVIDGLIAATGLTHGLQVITRNTRDMEASGVQLLNPWNS